MIEIKREYKRIHISLKAIKMGEDLCVILTGGDKPHLGAVTVGSSLTDLKTSTFEGHKENLLTEILGNILRKDYSGNFVICCGIHLDYISKDEIDDVLYLCGSMTNELCNKLK